MTWRPRPPPGMPAASIDVVVGDGTDLAARLASTMMRSRDYFRRLFARRLDPRLPLVDSRSLECLPCLLTRTCDAQGPSPLSSYLASKRFQSTKVALHAILHSLGIWDTTPTQGRI